MSEPEARRTRTIWALRPGSGPEVRSSMCGIVAYLGSRQAGPILLEGLKRMEYRGYDSAGLAVLNGTINMTRAVGRVSATR